MEPLKPPTTTSTLLLEQAKNHTAAIAYERKHHGKGGEASSIGTVRLQPWSPVPAAVEQIVERALCSSKTLGSAQQIADACERLDTHAQLLRESVRAQRLPIYNDEVRCTINTLINGTLPHMTTHNAAEKGEEILVRGSKAVGQVRGKIERDLREHYLPDAVLARLMRAVDADSGGPVQLRAALDHLRARLEGEPETIRTILESAERDIAREQENVRIHVQSVPRWFDWQNRLSSAQLTLSTSVPTLGRARLALYYLPCVQEGLAAVARAAKLVDALLSERERAADRAYRTLLARRHAREQQARSGRVLLLGVPEAQRDAEVQNIVETCWPTVARTLRNQITCVEGAVPADALLDTLLATVERIALERAPRRTLDDVLFEGRTPANVAHEIAAKIDGMNMPLALTPGADLQKLHGRRCAVVRVSRGSRLKDALVSHAGFDVVGLAESDELDQAEALFWQLGCSIEELDLYRQGLDEHALESLDPTTSPLHTIAPDAIVQRSGKAIPRASGAP